MRYLFSNIYKIYEFYDKRQLLKYYQIYYSMKYFKLSFDNDKLEQEFQSQIIKQATEAFSLYQSIFIIGTAILIVDSIIKKNLVMIIWLLKLQILQCSTLIISLIWPKTQKYIKFYYYYLDMALATAQLYYTKFYLVNLDQNDVQIYMDLLLQLFFLTQFRYNHIGASFMFIYFVSIRLYIQISNGFSLVSIGYVFSGLYFIIQQYHQEKNRRKLFIKSQRNKQLEYLIEEFIDDQVCIIEKDEQNITFKTIIQNKQITKSDFQFNQFLKEAKIPSHKSKLLNYLYKSTKQKDSLICSYQSQSYQITYQSFTLMNQQLFIKIKLLDQQISKIVNYKKLYQYIIQNISLKPSKLYKGKTLVKTIYLMSFYYSFSKYYKHYKVKLDYVSELFLQYLFNKTKIQWIQNTSLKSFKTDKKLFYILFHLIKNITLDELLIFEMKQEMIYVEFIVNNDNFQNQLTEINKILYHIGYGETKQTTTLNQIRISMVLLDKNGLERFY
ncbi:hypothetical protein pb186bvf_013592 [Paramecium bursaria]